YDVTVITLDRDSGEWRNYTMLSVDHEAEKAIDAYEAEFGADGYRAFPGNAPEQEALSDRTYAEEHLIPEETMFTIGNKPYMVDRVDLDSMTVHYQYIGVIIPQGEEIFHSAPVDVIRRYIEIDDIKMNLTPEQQTIVEAFETGGFVFNPSPNNEIRFDDAAGYPMTYKTWEDAYAAIDSTELRDSPGLRKEVQQILHPEPPVENVTVPEEPQEITTKTVAVYPAEEKHLPYDVVIQTIGTNEPKEITPENFRITDDDLGTGGAKAKFRMNMDAINTLKQIETEKRHATPVEQEILSKYVGWGGLADAFDDSKENWKSEYAELSAALTPEEYTAARSSTLNAHYTSPTVIKAIYEAVGNMGFQSGNILEPAMGVGNFFGLLPEEMAGSKLYGVELDSITGRIAKQLYPNADITVAGFETTDRRGFFDLAVGNVPFGNYKVNDRAYNKLGFSIHDYFFAKTLDQVRPGGVIAFVTSRYTMDKQSPEVRKYIAERADLLGAIRLPNNAFKKNAGTEVTTDILFLQKRDRPQVIEPDWVHLGQTPDGITVNSYFVEHPEMVLGTLKLDDMMYGDKKEVTCEPLPNTSLADLLKEAVKHIGGQYQEAELPDLGDNEAIDKTLPADPNVKNYSYTVVDGEVYYRENSIMVQPNLNATAQERVKGMVELRDCVHDLIDKQLYGAGDIEITQIQNRLNQLYDDFTAKYGLINDRPNRAAFAEDSSYYLLCSLEILDEDHKLKRKADMFTKRTIMPNTVITSVDTAAEALAVSIAEKARVDMPYMSELTGKSAEELVADLRGVIFQIPEPVKSDGSVRYVTADEYLSGNVREKLRIAEAFAADNPAFAVNVEALTAAQPKKLEAHEIDVRLGATWIDKEYIQQFMMELLNPAFYHRRKISVNYSEVTAEWNITGKSVDSNNINSYHVYGTDRINAYRILEDTLNLRDVRIYDTVTDADGKERRVLNSKETTLAQQKQQAIKDAFQDWIWKDSDRRHTLVDRYNELFNSSKPREYNGEHIRFNGMNPEISLREHQKNAVAHILYGGNTLLAHEVGAGKTFEMVAAAMESKRLGLCNKPLFAVPNHLTEQWASEFLRLYPSANILVTTKKDFEPANRKKFCARIATGNYDAVIMGHSQFEKIPMSKERQEQLLQAQIEEITEGIEELESSNAERFTIKQLERTKKSLEVKLAKLQDDSRKDDVITFEQLGVDRLYVDEAHSYKNCFLYTKMRNVAGLSTTDSQKSSDMLMKCRYLDEITGSKGVVFATGTPVSNSMTELYTMMRYLQHDTLVQKGLSHFDAWASTFGETSTAIELAPEGTGYRARTRFAKFFNLPELMNLFKEAADIKTADQLHLPTPIAVFHNVVAEPTEVQLAMMEELSERASKVHSGTVDPSIDNMLSITSDGRKLGLDQRIINPNLPDDPMSKVNMCVDNIFTIWQENMA
ncbi:MAG: DEAD/DEAH box helicase family protein, partial [Clostridia bacterium]|nr:DEAD/DEAH box helicase family protein [Clostridia bacterium]